MILIQIDYDIVNSIDNTLKLMIDDIVAKVKSEIPNNIGTQYKLIGFQTHIFGQNYLDEIANMVIFNLIATGYALRKIEFGSFRLEKSNIC